MELAEAKDRLKAIEGPLTRSLFVSRRYSGRAPLTRLALGNGGAHVYRIPMHRVTICVRVGSPEQVDVDAWRHQWKPYLRFFADNEGCRRCVDIYRVEALPDVLAKLPEGVIASQMWSDLAAVESKYCLCALPDLSERERRLLEDALDANDQLWDGKLSAADLWRLYTVAADGLSGTQHREIFEAAVAELATLVGSGLSTDEQRDRACGSTHDLRHYVWRQLRGKLQVPAQPAESLTWPAELNKNELPGSG